MGGQFQFAEFGECSIRMFGGNPEQGVLGRPCVSIDKIQDRTLAFAHDGGVWIQREVLNRCRVPMIAARQAAALVHSLLHHGPLAGIARDERVEIELKAVGDGVIVDLRREAARANQGISGEAR